MSELPAPPLSSHPDSGQRFGRFLLQECIGRGGMAEVFRAVAQGMEGFQRVFVVKRIHKEKSANPALRDMFVNEARISALLNHPNIVQVYDFGMIEDCYFISMEYLRGKDLLVVLRQLRAAGRIMPPTLAAYIAREVANGLAYAHELKGQGGKLLNIVHRDVSPSNVLLLRAGGVKLLDFGIAKANAALFDGGDGHATLTGLVKGKLSYLSPEQVRNEPLDARSDIFSLGVVLWECLTGKRLFYDKADYHTMNNVLSRPVPPPSMQRSGIPPALDFIAVRALERDVNHRYQHAKTLADDLDHYLAESRFPPRLLPGLLEELFGPEDNEVESLPPASRLALPSGSSDELPSTIARGVVAEEDAAGGLGPGGEGAAGGKKRRLPERLWEWMAQGGRSSVLLRVESDPPGAEVTTGDGRVLGTTPFDTAIPRSNEALVLTLRKAGFEEARQTLTPERHVTSLVMMRPRAGAAAPPANVRG